MMTSRTMTSRTMTSEMMTCGPIPPDGMLRSHAEARRGRGMFVNPGARALLMKSERAKFLGEEWPAIRERIQRLGLSPEDLLPRDSEEEG